MLAHKNKYKSKNKLICILLDSFRWDYINPIDTPFLYEKIEESIYAKQLITTQGFTQRTAILTGCDSSKTKLYSAYIFKNNSSKFKKDKTIFNFIDHLNWYPDKVKKILKFKVLGKLINKFNSLLLNKRIYDSNKDKSNLDQLPSICIPIRLLSKIDLAEDKDPIWLEGGCPVESIFDVMIKNNINYDYLMWPRTKSESDEEIHELINSSNGEFILAQFSAVDYVAHEYGPQSIETRKISAEIDRKLREIYQNYQNKANFIIFGDHGMTPVHKYINIWEISMTIARKYKFKIGKDFLIFLDSTVARYKWINQKACIIKEELKKNIEISEKGFWLTKKMAKDKKIELGSNYGDDFWCANNGVLIYPDFFHPLSEKNKGMHGYVNNIKSSNSFGMIFGKNIKNFYEVKRKATLLDLAPTISDLLKIRHPSSNMGKSLIE